MSYAASETTEAIPRDQSSHDVALLLRVAWTVELTGVSLGVVNSAYTVFGDHPPPLGPQWLAVLPLALLAATELLRLPLTNALCQKRGILVRGIALVALLIAASIAIENWYFGMERIVTLRMRPVQEARVALSEARGALGNLVSGDAANTAKDDGSRQRLTDIISLSKARLTQLASQEADAGRDHAAVLTQITAACKLIPGPCIIPRSREEDARYQQRMTELSAEQSRVEAELNRAQTHLDADDASIRKNDGRALERITAARKLMADWEDTLRKAADDNQIYRSAGMYFGVNAADVTDQQIGKVRGFFCLFSATFVSLAGSMAAMVVYMRGKEPTPSKLARAIRAWLARHRRRLVREVAKEVRVEVPKVIREIKLVPYTGGAPVDGLIPPTVGAPSDGGSFGSHDRPRFTPATDTDTNVTPISDRKRP
jgi:hypothetical protein